jgi:uncharacterized integral membrane protein
MFTHRTSWTPEKLRQWERKRERGMNHFILWNGIIYRGVTLFIIMITLLFLFETAGAPATYPPRSGFYIVAILVAVSSMVMGFIVGKTIWKTNETSYQRYLRLREQRTSTNPEAD